MLLTNFNRWSRCRFCRFKWHFTSCTTSQWSNMFQSFASTVFTDQQLLLSTLYINYCSEISTVKLQHLVTVYFWYDKAMMGLVFSCAVRHTFAPKYMTRDNHWPCRTGTPVGSMNVLTDDKLANIWKVPQKLTCRWYSPGLHEGLLDRFVHKLMFVVVIFVSWNANLSL